LRAAATFVLPSVLDNRAISAPKVRKAILSGQPVISKEVEPYSCLRSARLMSAWSLGRGRSGARSVSFSFQQRISAVATECSAFLGD
jgi:hypothetical protein